MNHVDRLYREILAGKFDSKVLVGGKECKPKHVQLAETINAEESQPWDYTKEEAKELLMSICGKVVSEAGGHAVGWDKVEEVARRQL